jgi:hypothetical protein
MTAINVEKCEGDRPRPPTSYSLLRIERKSCEGKERAGQMRRAAP